MTQQGDVIIPQHDPKGWIAWLAGIICLIAVIVPRNFAPANLPNEWLPDISIGYVAVFTVFIVGTLILLTDRVRGRGIDLVALLSGVAALGSFGVGLMMIFNVTWRATVSGMMPIMPTDALAIAAGIVCAAMFASNR